MMFFSFFNSLSLYFSISLSLFASLSLYLSLSLSLSLTLSVLFFFHISQIFPVRFSHFYLHLVPASLESVLGERCYQPV